MDLEQSDREAIYNELGLIGNVPDKLMSNNSIGVRSCMNLSFDLAELLKYSPGGVKPSACYIIVVYLLD